MKEEAQADSGESGESSHTPLLALPSPPFCLLTSFILRIYSHPASFSIQLKSCFLQGPLDSLVIVGSLLLPVLTATATKFSSILN